MNGNSPSSRTSLASTQYPTPPHSVASGSSTASSVCSRSPTPPPAGPPPRVGFIKEPIEDLVLRARREFDNIFARLLSELADARKTHRTREQLEARLNSMLSAMRVNERADEDLSNALHEVARIWRERGRDKDVLAELERMRKLVRSMGRVKRVRVVSPGSETSSIRATHRTAYRTNRPSSSSSTSSNLPTPEPIAWGPASPIPSVTQVFSSPPEAQIAGWDIPQGNRNQNEGWSQSPASPPILSPVQEGRISSPDNDIIADWNYTNPLPKLPISSGAPSLDTVTFRVKKLLEIRLWHEDRHNYISDQLVACANTNSTDGPDSVDNGRTLDRVIQLVVEKAVESSPVTIWRYAKLCLKLMTETSPRVELKEPPLLYGPRSDGIQQALTGPRLFRALLLSRCRNAFDAGPERFNPENLVTIRDRTFVKGKLRPIYPSPWQVYIAKKRWYGLMRFIGELWMVGMISEQIVVGCGERLMERAEKDEEDGVQAVGIFLMTVGKNLEDQRRETMDGWFDRLRIMGKLWRDEPRENMMLIDLIERRKQGWGIDEISRRTWPKL